LGDSALLKHFQTSQQQQQQQQSQQQSQHQEGRGDPDKAAAPPAPVWQAWVARHTSTAASSSVAAAAAAQTVATAAVPGAALPAAAGWYLQHQQQYQRHQQPPSLWQQQQQGPLFGGASLELANGSSDGNGGGAKSSSFNKYAAAVLQGLPPEDEAAQLAQMAAVHGYSLADVLQQHQQQRASNTVGNMRGMTVTPDGVSALLVKDPRSGRLSVAPGNAGGGSTGDSSAAELYGDLARWCDPASLERTLQKKRQQQQQQRHQGGRVSQGSTGRGGAAKHRRLGNE
jgi:hypothetical protein